jgi:hypothetical protein
VLRRIALAGALSVKSSGRAEPSTLLDIDRERAAHQLCPGAIPTAMRCGMLCIFASVRVLACTLRLLFVRERWHNQRAKFVSSSEYTSVAQDVKPWLRHGSGQPTEQTQRIHVDSDGAIRERAFELDTHEAALEQMQAFLRERRPQDVFAESFASDRVVRARRRRSMERKAAVGGRQRRRHAQA